MQTAECVSCGAQKYFPNAFKSHHQFRTITSLAASLVPEARAFALKFCCQACFSNLPSHITYHKLGGHIVVKSLDRGIGSRTCSQWRIFITLLRSDCTPIDPRFHFIGYLPVFNEHLDTLGVQVLHVVEEWLPEADVIDLHTSPKSQHSGSSMV